MFKNTLHQADFQMESRITLRAIGVVVIPYLHILIIICLSSSL